MAANETKRLNQIRTEIDEIDTQIIQLLAERQLLVEAAGRAKAGQATDAVRATERVEQVISTVRVRASRRGLSPAVAERTYRSMIAAFIDHELEVHAKL